jgi:spermidine dehydrogenase
MKPNRREFLKFIVAGSVAAGCPIDMSLLAAAPEPKSDVDGEHYEVCHQVRDGKVFARPLVSKRHDVIIVGGGVSGLAAAFFLQAHDFLILEKEAHWGGNATLEQYQGQAYCTGAAFDFEGSASERLAKEIGLKLLPVNNPDPTIVQGNWVPDTWGAGLDQLPYPASVRESFKKFRDSVLKLNLKDHPEQFDNEPLTKYLFGYAPEIKQWWDCYGPSNWGAASADTSALVALQELQDIAGYANKDDRLTLPGGNGAITKRLAEVLLAKHKEKMMDDATVIAVEQQKSEVHVTFVQQGQLKAVAARAVIMASPKFITARLVAGLPEAQLDAMNSLRYAPYPVINMVFDKPVYNRGYDTWCPGNTFTDITVADWTVRNQAGYRQKNNILTFYTPLAESQRKNLMTVESCRRLASKVLRDFQNLLPEFKVEPVEVHFYRRGHPMYMATPGAYTRIIPAARVPMERIFFANTDSEGPESLTEGAVIAARRGAEWAEKLLAGRSVGATVN